jgi:hypothetical protein
VGLRCVSEKIEMSVRERSKKSRNSRTVGKSKHTHSILCGEPTV